MYMGVFLDFPDCSFCLFVFSDTFLHCLNCLALRHGIVYHVVHSFETFSFSSATFTFSMFIL